MRFRTLGIISIVLWSAMPLASQAPPSPPSQLTVSGRVRVIEADTLEVWSQGTRLAVGVAGIKAPAGNTACGKEAIAAATQMIAGSMFLDDDPALPAFDRRFRRLYRVTTASGQSLATELALAGLAIAEPNDASGRDYADIVAGQAHAQSARRGCLWSDDSLPTR